MRGGAYTEWVCSPPRINGSRARYGPSQPFLLAVSRIIQALIGPRQVGKTTLARQVAEEWHQISGRQIPSN